MKRPQHGCCANQMPLPGRLTERVSYGHQYKPAGTECVHASDAILQQVEPVARAIVLRIEDHFAGGRQRGSWRFNEVERPDLPHRSEEHTSELQSLRHLVCRLLLEKKKK